MRTLVVIHSLKMGGMERMAVNLADAFARAGHESHLLACRARPNDLSPAESGVRVHRFDQLRARLSTGVGLFPFLLSRLLLGVLIPRSHHLWVGWLDGWLLKRRVARIESVHGRFDRIIFRGLGTFKYFWTFRDERNVYVLENVMLSEVPRWLRRTETRLLFSGRHLSCVSSGVRRSIEQRLQDTGQRPASLRVIFNQCPVEDIRRLMREHDADIPPTPYLLNVARLVPQKGHRRLLEAYALAVPEEPLVIIGDGPLRPALEKLARTLGIGDRVRFLGQKHNPYPWMHQARLFVLSSEYEGFGLVLLEALVCGTPVVAVDCPGGIRDVLKGALEDSVSAMSAPALAEKMSAVLAQPPPVIRDEWLDDFRESRIVAAFLAPPEAMQIHAAD